MSIETMLVDHENPVTAARYCKYNDENLVNAMTGREKYIGTECHFTDI